MKKRGRKKKQLNKDQEIQQSQSSSEQDSPVLDLEKSIIKKLIKQGGYWNSGMFLIRKDSVINNFKRYQFIQTV